jgi:phosphoribosylformylglycinamidine (FGAM) synthase-like enzyme
VCVARRQATSTPLQALVFWNDPQFVEAARALAQRVLQMQFANQEDQLITVFRLLTSRRPTAEELAILHRFFEEQCTYFAHDPENAAKFLSVGDQQRAPELDVIQLAALSAVAQSLLSYDQTVMKR